MIDDVHLLVGASSAGLAAGLTWLGHLPGRRRAASDVRRTQEWATQTAALAERTALEATARAERTVEEAEARARLTVEKAAARAERDVSEATALAERTAAEATALAERTAARAVDEARAAAQREIDGARLEGTANWSQLQLVMAELDHLVEVRLPAVAQALDGAPASAPTGLRRPDLLAGSEVAERLAEVEAAMHAAADAVRARVEDAARAGVRVAAEEIQASLTRAQRDIDNAFDDEDDLGIATGSSLTYAQTLARVDHSVTLAAHTAQRLRILTESWPGVQRANCTIAEIVESARGRIRQSGAVQYTYQARTGETVVEGLIVEPTIVALTELLDNATAYSGGAAATHVLRVPGGMRVTVEDQGLGMSPLQLQEAERALDSGTTDVTALADPGRLGFAVIGRLTHTYGLRVGLSPSASGGIKATLLIPARHLVAEEPEEPKEVAPREDRPREHAPRKDTPEEVPPRDVAPQDVTSRELARPEVAPSASAAPASAAPASDGTPERTALGLPKRQPRRTTRQESRPRQEEVSDAGEIAEGFARLRGVLAEGYGDEDSVKGG